MKNPGFNIRSLNSFQMKLRTEYINKIKDGIVDMKKEALSIVEFLKENDVYDLDDFKSLSKIDKNVFISMLNVVVTNEDEKKEIVFLIEMELSKSKVHLKEILEKYESLEDYDKCILVREKIRKIK